MFLKQADNRARNREESPGIHRADCLRNSSAREREDSATEKKTTGWMQRQMMNLALRNRR